MADSKYLTHFPMSLPDMYMPPAATQHKTHTRVHAVCQPLASGRLLVWNLSLTRRGEAKVLQFAIARQGQRTATRPPGLTHSTRTMKRQKLFNVELPDHAMRAATSSVTLKPVPLKPSGVKISPSMKS